MVLEFIFGYLLGEALGEDRRVRTKATEGDDQCRSTQAFAGGEEVWRCRLTAGHDNEHRGTLERGS